MIGSLGKYTVSDNYIGNVFRKESQIRISFVSRKMNDFKNISPKNDAYIIALFTYNISDHACNLHFNQDGVCL